MTLRWLQRCGHKPVVLIGGGTTQVGDPSFRDTGRPLLDGAEIAKNIAGLKQVFSRYLTFGDGPTDAVMVDNADWLDPLRYLPFLREFGTHFTVNRMLSFDSVRQRLEREQPLTVDAAVMVLAAKAAAAVVGLSMIEFQRAWRPDRYWPRRRTRSLMLRSPLCWTLSVLALLAATPSDAQEKKRPAGQPTRSQDPRARMEQCADKVMRQLAQARVPEAQAGPAVAQYCDASLRAVLAKAIQNGEAAICTVETCTGIARERVADEVLPIYRELLAKPPQPAKKARRT
jgi:hypothetical protein